MRLKTELMPHQRDAFAKVSRHRVGALFMDMGTGKSRTAIELIHLYRQRTKRRCVWICPVNAKPTIAAEIAKHSSGLTVATEPCPQADVVIIGTESISQSDRVYLAMRELLPGCLLILDESHDFKTPFAKRTRRMMRDAAKAHARYLMTGTPMTRGFEDLFCQFYILSPKILGYSSWSSFAHYHLEFDPAQPGRIKRRKYEGYVTTKIAPYVYQVTKDECLSLPAKTYSQAWFALAAEQAALYERVKDEILNDPDFWGMDSGIMIYRLLSALQRVVSGFDPLADKPIMPAEENPRIRCLLDTLDDVPAGAQAIIWAKYSADIDAILSVLPGACRLDGKTQDRQAEIARFRAGERFLVANPATGGTALTLNEASYAVFYSQSFKWAERVQAEDRCHRIGQARNVHYITIEAHAGIDSMISKVLTRRENAVDALRREINAVRKMTDKRRAKAAIKKLRETL